MCLNPNPNYVTPPDGSIRYKVFVVFNNGAIYSPVFPGHCCCWEIDVPQEADSDFESPCLDSKGFHVCTSEEDALLISTTLGYFSSDCAIAIFEVRCENFIAGGRSSTEDVNEEIWRKVTPIRWLQRVPSRAEADNAAKEIANDVENLI